MRPTFLTLLFVACAQVFANPGPATTTRPDSDNLTQSFAAFRKQQVKSVSYDLSFQLSADANTYDGVTQIHVQLAETDAPLSVDFLGKTIKAVRIDGTSVSDYTTRSGSFDIPAKYLKSQMNIEVSYTNEFGQTPTGFYRYVDPADHKVYLYTDFEPYQAHRLFPCFDQPDLKATYNVTVVAPRSWRVISNGIGQTAALGTNAKTKFHFTHPLSTYLFFLGAGDYKEWRSHQGKLPLFIYARQSMAKYVDSQAIFSIIKKGLSFYSAYFGYPYPFPKYGEVFIPDFDWGGMENPGAITMSEDMIYRGHPNMAQLRRRENTTLHEMAHMWFGDLVTMKWWNDTWLNESFATYMATLAQSEAMKDPASQADFFSEKTWGYWQDSLVTTHPIEAPIPDTVNAASNFDGITYAKGASALQQLRYFAGPEAFQKGIRSYFKKYAKSNAVRADFVAEIAKAAHKNLDDWTHAWLQSAGPNRVQAEWQCSDLKITSFQLKQEKNAGGFYSPHRTKIGLYKKDKSGHLRKYLDQDVAYVKDQTAVPQIVGSPCPDFVYPNEDDEDYASFSLDPASLKVAESDLSSLESPLLRLMVWHSLNEMVWEGTLRPMDYMRTAMLALPKETDENMLSVLLNKHSALKDVYFTFLSSEQRQKIAGEFESMLWNLVANAKPNSNLQLTYFDFTIGVARTSGSQTKISSLLDGKNPIGGLQLDQDRRWKALEELSASGDLNSRHRIDAELKTDSSNRGQNSGFAALNAFPEAHLRTSIWQDLVTPGTLNASKFMDAIRWFQDPNRPDLEKPFVDQFFKTMESLDWNNPVHRDRVGSYFAFMFPHLCNSDLLEKSESELKGTNHLNDDVVRAWRVQNDQLSRCVRARSL